MFIGQFDMILTLYIHSTFGTLVSVIFIYEELPCIAFNLAVFGCEGLEAQYLKTTQNADRSL